jgi:hypothetical protein
MWARVRLDGGDVIRRMQQVAPLALLALAACSKPVDSGIAPSDEWLPAVEGVTYTLSGSQLDSLGNGGRITMQTVQGIVNRDAPNMFLAIDSGDTHDSEWLDLLSREYALDGQAEQDVTWYLWAFKNKFDGYILFRNTNKASVNAAVTLSGALNAMAIDQFDQDLFKFMEEELQLPQLVDVRDWTDQDLLDSPEFAQAQAGLVMMEYFSGPEAAPRDFAVSKGLPVVYADVRDAEFPGIYESVWAGLSEGAEVYGWGVPLGGDPDPLVRELAARQLRLVPTGNANNLSVYAHFPFEGDLVQIKDADPPNVDQRHVVAFVMSGGENLGTLLGRLTNEEVGNFKPVDSYPIGWTMTDAVRSYAGPIAEWLYTQSGGDNWFLMGASGPYLAYPSLINNHDAWTQQTIDAMALMDHRVLQVTDDVDALSIDPYTELLASSQVDAVFWAPSDLEETDFVPESLLWSGGKPLVPMYPLGFDPDVEKTLDVVDQFAADLAERATDDLTTFEGYSLVYVNAEKTRLTDLEELESELEAQADELGLSFQFEVVRPDELLTILMDNVAAE